MGRKLLALVPTALPTCANLERFHADATDVPFLSVVVWTSRSSGDAPRARQVALTQNKTQLLELQRVEPPEGARSWFVGNRVVQNGSVTLLSPLDALFVLLDAAWSQRKRFSSVYDLLARDNNTWLLQLTTLDQEKLETICDLQTVGEDGLENVYVKVNEGKVTEWLHCKVVKVATVLAQQEKERENRAARESAFASQVHLPGQKLEKGPADGGKREGGHAQQEDVTRHHRQAIDVLGNYLPDEWIGLLCKEFKVKKEVEVKTPAKFSAGAPIDTFKRFDRRQTPESGSKRPTSASVAAAKKKSKLADVDRTGMKSLTSFFGKK